MAEVKKRDSLNEHDGVQLTDEEEEKLNSGDLEAVKIKTEDVEIEFEEA